MRSNARYTGKATTAKVKKKLASECWSASYEADDERLVSSVGQPVGAVREEQRALVLPNAFVAVELIRQRPPRLVEVGRHVEVRSAGRFGPLTLHKSKEFFNFKIIA